MDCPSDDMDCQNIREILEFKLKNLYYYNTYLESCPPLNDSHNWHMMKKFNQPCPKKKNNEATCTLGKVEIRTVKHDKNGEKTESYNHAQVMGCANTQLLHKIRTAYQGSGVCDYTHWNFSRGGVERHIQLEHCMEMSRMCNKNDYCVGWKESTVKKSNDTNDDSNNRFDFTTKIGILAAVVVAIMAIFLAGMYLVPVGRVSDHPNMTLDECETGKVCEMTEKDELDGSKATSKGNGTGPLGKIRPKMPPPPTPIRLVGGTTGSVPV